MPTDPTPDPRAARARALVAAEIEKIRAKFTHWNVEMALSGDLVRAELAAWEYVAEVLAAHETERTEHADGRTGPGAHPMTGRQCRDLAVQAMLAATVCLTWWALVAALTVRAVYEGHPILAGLGIVSSCVTGWYVLSCYWDAFKLYREAWRKDD